MHERAAPVAEWPIRVSDIVREYQYYNIFTAGGA